MKLNISSLCFSFPMFGTTSKKKYGGRYLDKGIWQKSYCVPLPCFVCMHEGCDLREMVLWDKTEWLALVLSL